MSENGAVNLSQMASKEQADAVTKGPAPALVTSPTGTMVLISEEQAKGYQQYTQYIQNSIAMQQISQGMREIPVLPSEKPKDVQPLEEVIFPEEGGILTKMGGMKNPYKGFPFFEFVDGIDTVKKVLRSVLSSFFHSMKRRSKWQLATLILVPWLFTDLIEAFVYSLYRTVERYRVKPIRYCTAMRELYRAFSVEWRGETPRQKEMRFMVRDLCCMTLEFDNAYRFRFQDVIVELDKEALNKNPVREILRLSEIMTSREQTQEIKDTWSLLKKFLPLYAWLVPSLKQQLVGILNELDLKKVKLSTEDIEFCEKRKDYQFGFMSHV